MQLFQFLFVFLAVDGGRQIHVLEFGHFLQREVLLKGLAHIAPRRQGLVDPGIQQLHGIPHGGLFAAAVQDMPWHAAAGLFHELVVGFQETLVFFVLPQILRGDAPFRFGPIHQILEAIELLVLIDVQEDFQHHVAAVPQLALKLVHLAHPALVFLFGDFMAQVLAHCAFHPAGIQEHKFAVLGNGRKIGIEEGIAFLAFRYHRRGAYVVKPGVDLTDQLLDQRALARRGPALDQHQHGQLLIPDQLLLRQQLFPNLFDFRVQGVLVLRLFPFKILQHPSASLLSHRCFLFCKQRNPAAGSLNQADFCWASSSTTARGRPIISEIVSSEYFPVLMIFFACSILS